MNALSIFSTAWLTKLFSRIGGDPLYTESVWFHTGIGFGSVANKIIVFGTEVENKSGQYVQIENDATNGFRITVLQDNIEVNIDFTKQSSGSEFAGLTLNATPLETTTIISGLPASKRLAQGYNGGGNESIHTSAKKIFQKDDVIRPHTNSGSEGTNGSSCILVTARKVK